MYNRLIINGVSSSESLPYLICWKQNEIFAKICENKEFNINANENWKSTSKKDPRKMWKKIDYNEKEHVKSKQYIEPNIIHNYFKNIFQAEHLQS